HDRIRSRPEVRDGLKRSRLVPPVLEVGVSNLAANWSRFAACDRRGEHDDAIRILITERLQQDCVGDAENCRVRTDAKRHDRHAEERKAGISARRAQGVPYIAPDVIQPHERPRISMELLRLLDTAEGALRGEPSFFWR